MASALRPLTMLAAVLAVAPALLGQQPNLGYDDTPMQPDGKWRIHDSLRPRPFTVTPQPMAPAPPPADAIVLIGPGADLSRWQADDGSAPPWPIANGVLQTGKGFAHARRIRRHAAARGIRHAVAGDRRQPGAWEQRRLSRRRLRNQVLDSYRNPTYADGRRPRSTGSIRRSSTRSRGPGEWRSCDIAFRAPRFSARCCRRPP
jgi:hypothetical protein